MASPAASVGGGDLSIQMPAAATDPAGGESQRRGSTGAGAEPEKSLNYFVRVLATMELVGNALGTLASLWASFVLIGGYRTTLEHDVDFWIATVMIFIEAFRVFIRNFKFDNQSLFGSTNALRGMSSSFVRMLWRPREGNEVLLVFSWVVNIFDLLARLGVIGSFFRMAGLALMTRMQLITETPRLMRQLRENRPLLLWVVLITPPAIAVLVVPLLALRDITAQFVAVVLLNWRPQCITTLTSCPWGQMILAASKLILVFASLASVVFPWTMQLAAVVLLFGSLQDPAVANNLFGRCIDVIMNLCFLWSLLFPSPLDIGLFDAILLPVLLISNLQIPAAVAQIVLSSWRLIILHGDDGPTNMDMKASMAVFYGLALCQGSLYIVACILALFSFFPRRSLVHRSDFRGKWGAKAVDLYYEHAYMTRMEAGVFAEDTISLASFALDSLNSTTSSSTSSTRDKQLSGVRVLHSLLHRKDSRQGIISVITRSEKAVPRLIGMLGWSCEEDRDIRLFAAMVTKELSGELRISGIPGGVKLVSSLLDVEKQSASVNNEGGRDHHHGPGPLGPQADDGGNQIRGRTGNTGDNVANNQPQDEESSGNARNASNRPGHEQSEQRGGNHGARCWSRVLQCWPGMKQNWSIPDEQPSSQPILGLEILEGLACDTDNCAEIIKVTNLVPKIIDLTSYSSSNESSTDNALKQLISPSLNLLRRLATRNGKIGATLRQELWENPFLISNLAGILENSPSTEVLKLAMDIIAIMAWDEVARQELGSAQVIIRRLVRVFVGQDGPTKNDQSVRVAAGEALTILALESPVNCLAILEERQPGYQLVKDLKDMLGNDQYRCVAAGLLQNLCACSSIRDRLRGREASNHLSSDALLMVLENIRKTAEGKQLEALIGLASQICYVLPPQRFVQGLESRIIGETCVKLVGTLNSNKRPNHEYPRMRRAIVEMVISVLERYPHYATIFRREGMMDALSIAQKNPSRVEKYRIFLGNEGVVLEHGSPLRDLVARARGLIDSLTTLTRGAQPREHA